MVPRKGTNLMADGAGVMRGEIQKIWSDDYRVRSYDVDFKKRVALPNLCRFMQESAWNHAEHLGIGYSRLIEKNLVWVLSRQLVKMDAFPKRGDTVRILTWPTRRDRLFCYRDFKILDDRDRLLGTATTAWFAIDLPKRKPQRTDSYFDLNLEVVEPLFPEGPGKIEALAETKPVRSVEAGYQDLDVNSHVNNVKYVEWILEGMPLDFHATHRLREMGINYLSEALYGDRISISRQKKEGGTFLHCLRREGDGKELCRAETSWVLELEK